MDETSSNINAEETNCLPRATGNRQGTEPLGPLKVTQWGQKKRIAETFGSDTAVGQCVTCIVLIIL